MTTLKFKADILINNKELKNLYNKKTKGKIRIKELNSILYI